MYSRNFDAPKNLQTTTPKEIGVSKNDPSIPKEEYVRPVSSEDHILGNSDAPINIIEYSDTECPFCKNFHETMHRIIADYNGKVAWTYRHFPLHQIHPKAIPEAEATECAAELGGNDAFWKYLDRIFAITPSNNGLDLTLLPEIAAYANLDREAFQKCIDERKHAQKVADDYNNAVASGGRGTPYSILITKNGKKTILSGALSYDSIKTVVENALKN